MFESILDFLASQESDAAMKVKLYDRVLLTDGNPASIVEIFEEGKFFLADIDKDGDTYTEDISAEDILRIL